jgi:uncharacterized membrane protein
MTEDSEPNDANASGEPEVEFIAAERVIFFSDAVVAIAITLLALGLPLPHGSSNTAVWHSLRGNRDAYIAFLISFAVIGAHWRTHHRLFRAVARLDTLAIGLNSTWLLMIIITPYATRVLSGNGGFGVRFGFYAAVQVVTLVTLWLMSRHIRQGHLLRPGMPAGVSAIDDVFVLTIAAMFALSIPLAFIRGFGQWVYVVWVVVVVVARNVRRAQRWRAERPT